MIILPTRNRPKSVIRFIKAYVDTGATLPVQIIIDSDDKSYDGLVFPSHWPAPFINDKECDLNAGVNAVFNAFPNEPFYGFMADDIIPQSMEWDIKLRDACIPHYIAWGDDGIRQANALDAPALCTHPFIGGDLARSWGWLLSPYTNRHCQDLIWRDFANELNIGKFLPDVHTLHAHWQAGRGEYDSTYAIQPPASEGHKQYHEGYKGSTKFYDDVKRVRDKLAI